MLIAPLAKYAHGPAWPTVFGLSGYSGAGTVTGPNDEAGRPTTLAKMTAQSLGGGVKPYSLTDHIHEREAGRHLSNLADSQLKVAFVPTVATWFSGILAVLSMPLSEKLAARDVRALYEEKYANERLVTIKKDVPVLPDIEKKHGFVAGGFQVHSEGDRAVVVVRVIFSLSFSCPAPEHSLT